MTNTIGSVLLIKYYHHRNYRFAFITEIIAVIATIGFSVLVCIILTSGELKSYYAPALLVSLCAGVVYAAGLVFSSTREKFWLKLAGAYYFAIGVILVSILVAYLYAHNAQTKLILQKTGQWASMTIGLVPAIYIMNFVNEIKILTAESANPPKQKSLENILGFAVISIFMFTLTLGALLIKDGFLKLYWQRHAAEAAQRIVKLAGGESTFVNSKKDSLHYILVKPQNFDPQKKYPLIVCLPYGGYLAPAAELLTTSLNRRTYPAFIFVPYCVEGTGWGGIPGYPSKDLLVYETITALVVRGIDVKRRYVTGVSRGGYGTWQFICTRPDMFAAAIPVCGGGDLKLASKITNIPIWAFHGAKDKNVPVSGSRDIIAAIKKAGGRPKYTEFPNESHDIWDQVSKTPGLLDWLFAQRRE